ncbi:MAG: hypothetical protein AAF901_13605, partial [Bacteroidota bacterium]
IFFYDSRSGYWLAAFFIYTGEIAVNYSAIVNIGEIGNLFAMLLAFAVSGLMSITAMKAGAALQSRKYIEGSLWGLAGFALCAGVMALRIEDNLILSLAVFAFYVISLLLSYAKSINFDWFQINRQIKKISKKLAKVRTQATRLESENELTKTIIHTEHEGQTGTYSMSAKRNLQNQIDEYTALLLKLDSLHQQYAKSIESLFIQGCLCYDQGYCNMAKLLFRKIDLEAFNTQKLSLLPSSTKVSQNGQHQSSSTIVTIIVIALSTFLASCSQPQTYDVTVLIDQTHEHQISPNDFSDYIFDEVIQLKEKNIRNPVQIAVSTIGETSKQPIKKLLLPDGGSWITRRDAIRKQEIEDFRKKVAQLIQDVMKASDSLAYSFVYDNTKACIERSSALPQETNRSLLILSDLLLHTPDLSFYRHPKLLEDWTHLDSLLTKTNPLPSCEGLNIQLLYMPDRNTDASFSKSLDFFTQLYERHQAKVTYVPSI